MRDSAAAQYGSGRHRRGDQPDHARWYNKSCRLILRPAYFSEGSNFLTGGSDGKPDLHRLQYTYRRSQEAEIHQLHRLSESRGWANRMKGSIPEVFTITYNGIERLARTKTLSLPVSPKVDSHPLTGPWVI